MFKIISREEYTSLKAKVSYLTEKNQELKKENDKLIAKNYNLNLTKENTLDDLLNKNLENIQLKDRLAVLQKEVEKVNASKGGFTKKINEDKEEIKALKEENKKLDSEVVKKDIIINGLHDKIAKLEEEARKYWHKAPSKEELKTEKMNKVDRSKLIK